MLVEDFSRRSQHPIIALVSLIPIIQDYLSSDESCDLEKEPLTRLAKEGQLAMYRHEGRWQCMDTLRDSLLLNALWDKGEAFWSKS